MTVNHDQAIFDAIVAATSANMDVVIDTKKFIDTFNNHRDRKLCTSLDVAHSPPAFHASHNFGERLPSGDAADAGGETYEAMEAALEMGKPGIERMVAAVDPFMENYKRDTTNAMAARILELEAMYDEAVANAARWEQRFNGVGSK